MSPAEDVKAVLVEHLKELHLPAMRDAFEAAAQQAQQEALSYEQYLLELAERECQARRQNRIERLRRQSRLPLEKTLDAFDLKRLPAKVLQQVRTLLDGSFLDRRENLLAFGNPGVVTYYYTFQRSGKSGSCASSTPVRRQVRPSRTAWTAAWTAGRSRCWRSITHGAERTT